MSVSPFHLSKRVSYHIHIEMYMYSRQPVKIKVFFEDSGAEIFVQQNVKNYENLVFLRNDHTKCPTCFNFNSKFPLFAKKV